MIHIDAIEPIRRDEILRAAATLLNALAWVDDEVENLDVDRPLISELTFQLKRLYAKTGDDGPVVREVSAALETPKNPWHLDVGGADYSHFSHHVPDHGGSSVAVFVTLDHEEREADVRTRHTDEETWDEHGSSEFSLDYDIACKMVGYTGQVTHTLKPL